MKIVIMGAIHCWVIYSCSKSRKKSSNSFIRFQGLSRSPIQCWWYSL